MIFTKQPHNTMKRSILLIELCLCQGLFFPCLNVSAQIPLHVGEREFLEVPDPPHNGYIEHSNWTSDVGVAIVSGDNTYGATVYVTRYFEGSVIVNVTYTYTYYDSSGRARGGQSSKSWSISCIPIKVSADKTEINLKIGQKATIKTSYPSSEVGWMQGIKYEWDISDDGVASLTVNNSAVSATVTGKRPGKTTITLNPVVGPEVRCYVTVVSDPPTGISISPGSLILKEGSKGSLSCSFTPENTVADVVWESSDSNIASVSQGGTVSALSEGTVTITAKTDNGLKATASVTVAPKPTQVALSGPNKVPEGYSIHLQPVLQPSNALSDYTWTTSDFTVATVNDDGTIKGVKSGDAIINVKTENGITASYVITVYPLDDNMNSSKVRTRVGVLKSIIQQVNR